MSEINSFLLRRILEDHAKWLKNHDAGHRADLSGADLRHVALPGVDLSWAILSDADLQGAKLCGAKATWVDFHKADLWKTDFSQVNLTGANLSYTRAWRATFDEAIMRGVNLKGAELGGASFRETDLSGARGLTDPIDYIKENFETNRKGVICYKIFYHQYKPPEYWTIEPGAVLREVVNPLPADICGSGINVGTLKWMQRIREHSKIDTIWECLIKWEWLPSVVVPYRPEGCIRTGRLQLIKKCDVPLLP